MDRDLPAYRKAITALRANNPTVFEAYVHRAKAELEASCAAEDRPMTAGEVDATAGVIADELGWSRSRVVAEAILRFQLDFRDRAFVPLTPEETPELRAGKYARRPSSMTAIALGDVAALMRKHTKK